MRQKIINGLVRLIPSAVAIVALCALYEGYRRMGLATDEQWPIIGGDLPVKTNQVTMPPLWDIITRFFEPQQRRSSTTVLEAVIQGSWYTMRISLAGFVMGATIGMSLAVIMLRSKLLEKGILPWVIVSQTIPLLALAPVIVTWGNRIEVVDWQPWMSVSLIATYLTFFPVAVNGLRGLQSPPAHSIELMESYASTRRQTLLKVRLPGAVPYIVPALKLAAAASIIGSIVGEISIGLPGGVGRLILGYAQQAQTDPPKMYCAIIGAGVLGLVFTSAIGGLERLMPGSRQRSEMPA
ncbi:MAG: NitT/TauT family transport system permease protein [Candidatus Aldehydirespiratoraceae bacterium]|jgi:NitT/TauT family transport system permease protein